MLNKITYSLLIICLFGSLSLRAQNNERVKTIAVYKDTVQLDTLSIVPNSVVVSYQKEKIDTSFYKINFLDAQIILDVKALLNKHIYNLKVQYRYFPINLKKSYYHKDITKVQEGEDRAQNPFTIKYNDNTQSVFNLEGLNKNGSISRGITIGNTQDLSVNSDLNLQISGKITDDINIKAAISDKNIPIQPEGNTQQLQQFDNVYVKLYNEFASLTAGDFNLDNPSSYFMNFNKRAQGGKLQSNFYVGKADDVKDKGKVKLEVSGAASKGKYSRSIIQGMEGNQGPYKLEGADGETYIVVLAGTEQVFLDGKLMKRGSDYDYVIDYNTAELTFTSTNLITQNSRIIFEFQYTSLSYVRSLFFASGQYENKNMQLNVDFYNEQDAKNQPLQQELSESQKRLLRQAGDSTNQAVVPTAENKGFDNEQVRYKKIFQLGYDSIFVYSTNPDSAVYQVDFSFVGNNKGNYIQIKSTANGRVFKWIKPKGTIPQGNYSPYSVLIAPKKTQMLTVNSIFNLGKNTKISWEGAMSDYDKNTFSKRGNEDNIGLATRIKIDNQTNIGSEESPTDFTKGLSMQYIDEDFHSIEHFRSVEFNRDWNIRGLKMNNEQLYATGYLGISKKDKGLLKYTTSLFNVGNQFNGFKNNLNLMYQLKNYKLQGEGSYLTSKGFETTSYLKYHATLSKTIGKVEIGGYTEQEKNLFRRSDSLLGNSYQWNILKAFIKTNDSLSTNFGAAYTYREDFLPFNNDLKMSSIANDFSLNMGVNQSKNSKLNFQATYRKLQITDSAIAQSKPEETILGKINYDLKLLKGVIISNTYYRIGSGLELKKEFQYIEVAAGQGVYTWTDYNDDGIKQLNEFEVAAFQDKANYIRVYVPSNEYVKVYTNEFNELLYIRPEAVWYNKKGIRKFLSRFSNKLVLSGLRKTREKKDVFDPFKNNINDTAMMSLSNSFLNSLYFNRNSSKYGIEYDFAQNNSKDITTNGFESASNKYNLIKTRINLTRNFFLNNDYKQGLKGRQSEISSESNYNYHYLDFTSEIGFQPSTKFRISISYDYKEKKNDMEFGNQKTFMNKAGANLRWNIPSKASITADFNVIYINYNSLANTSIAYDMLEGLQPGQNYTWSLGWQHNLAKNLQMNILYSGRKTENNKIIHTGNVQVRAYF